MAELMIVEERLPGTATGQSLLSGLPELITAAELIRWRVREEVVRRNLAINSRFAGVQVSATENSLNPPKEHGRPMLDWQAEAEKALAAFAAQRFFLFVDGEQINDIEQQISVTTAEKATFLQLVPLVGG